MENLQAQLREERRLSRVQAKRLYPLVYSDPERQFRFEVELAWLMSIPERERESDFKLREYKIGHRFLETVERLSRDGGVGREQLVRTVAEVVSGWARTKASRAVKEWRTSKQGSQQVRADGAAAWRVRVQSNTPSARRLKYWRLPDGTIELDSVGTHDEGL